MINQTNTMKSESVGTSGFIVLSQSKPLCYSTRPL